MTTKAKLSRKLGYNDGGSRIVRYFHGDIPVSANLLLRMHDTLDIPIADMLDILGTTYPRALYSILPAPKQEAACL